MPLRQRVRTRGMLSPARRHSDSAELGLRALYPHPRAPRASSGISGRPGRPAHVRVRPRKEDAHAYDESARVQSARASPDFLSLYVRTPPSANGEGSAVAFECVSTFETLRVANFGADVRSSRYEDESIRHRRRPVLSCPFISSHFPRVFVFPLAFLTRLRVW